MSDFQKLRREMKVATRARETQMSRENRAAIAPARAVRAVASNIAEDFRAGRDKYQASQEELFRPRKSLFSGETAADIGYGTLNELAGMAQMATSPITGALRSVLPMETIGGAISAVTPDRVKQLAADYPRQAQALGNIAEIALPKVGLELGKTGLTNLAMNTPTEIPGFYGPVGPAGQVIAAAKVAGPQIGRVLNQMVNPNEIARTRQVGAGKGRRNEYVTRALEGDANKTRGTSLASGFMDTQTRNMTDRPDSVFGQSREMQKYTQDFFDLSDTNRIKQNLTTTSNVPEIILDRAVNHLKAIHGVSDAPGATSLVVRRRGSGEGLQGEARGTATTANNMLKFLRGTGGVYSQIEKVFPDLSKQERLSRLGGIANAADRNAMIKASGDNLGPSTIKNKDGSFKGSSLLVAQYLRAKQKPKGKLTNADKELVKYFDNAKDMRVNEVSDGVYAMHSSHRSTAQDLGGMNDFIAVDTNANKVYSMTSDGHDMFGMNPPGGNSLLNVLPIEVFGLGSGKSQRVKKQEVVGDPDISAIERLTGVEAKRGPQGGMLESGPQYQARAVRDVKAMRTPEDVREAATNIGRMVMFCAALAPEEEKGR